MRSHLPRLAFAVALVLVPALAALCAGLADQPPNTWVKRSPLAHTPPSPRLGYEGTWAYDPIAKLLIHWGGHNQGGGGEQHSETWTFDPVTARWTLKEPNDYAPGICCGQQNVFDPARNRFVRFPSFSGSHGWQWWREIYLKNTTVWTYDLAQNTWRNLRPMPEPAVSPLRCAAWDSDHEVIVVFGGEGNTEGTVVYDPYVNTWTKRNPPSQPAFRSGGNMAYDSANKLHILFGAQFTNDPHTWAYDLAANRWTDLKPAAMPPTDKNDAVLTYDSANRKVLAIVKSADKLGAGGATSRLETWAFDAGQRKWTKMNPKQEPDPSGNRARLLTFLPDHGLAILENRTHPPRGPAEQQIWTYRYAHATPDANPILTPPTQVRATTAASSVTLTWKRLGIVGPTRYVIYRGQGSEPWAVKFAKVGTADGDALTYEDRDVKPGEVYHYVVRSQDAAGQEGPPSNRARAQPRIVEDAVVSVKSASAVELTWSPPEGSDIAGYHIERAIVEVYSDDQLTRLKKSTPPLGDPSVGAIRRVSAFQRLTQTPVKAAGYADKVDLEKPQPIEGKPLQERRFGKEDVDPEGKPYRFAVYAYRIRAVNALGVESGPSPMFLTIPSAPQWVFSREQAGKCDLKWAKNPEAHLKGYRVYRLDGRFNGPPVSRLTADPITALTFTDEGAGKPARRYHIVAVDALGQEGIPSAPVWYEREWKPFYKPFVGEWHQ